MEQDFFKQSLGVVMQNQLVFDTQVKTALLHVYMSELNLKYMEKMTLRISGS